MQQDQNILLKEISELKDMMGNLCKIVSTQQKEITDLNNQLTIFNKAINGNVKTVQKEDIVKFYTQKNRAKMILKNKAS